MGVPRVWEKLRDKIQQVQIERRWIKAWLLSWARGVGTKHAEMSQYNYKKKEKSLLHTDAMEKIEHRY